MWVGVYYGVFYVDLCISFDIVCGVYGDFCY